MKLSIVIPVLNQKLLFYNTFKRLKENTNTLNHEVEFVVIDNGCNEPILDTDYGGLGAIILRNEKTVGVYPTFKQGMDGTSGDIVAFLHDDVLIHEKFWNDRVMEEFKKNPKLGLLGFIGSNQIDYMGGRGVGTASNFMGLQMNDGEYMWIGSKAEIHGKRITGYMKSAVVDGCVMILRREAWDKIGYRENFPPHHFYDRLIATQMLENKYEVGTLGIECDHFSGQTVYSEQAYHDMCKEWCKKRNIPIVDGNADLSVYQEGQRQWTMEYREKKHIFPITV